MKKYSLLSILGVAAFAQVGLAQESRPVIQISKRVSYQLSADRALKIKDNLARLVNDLELKPNEGLVIRVNAEDELDLTIYEQDNFATIKIDGMKLTK